MSTDRTGYTAGLRALADMLDNNPNIPVPWEGGPYSGLSFFFSGDNTRANMIHARRAIGGQWAETPGGSEYLRIQGDLAGLRVDLIAKRDQLGHEVRMVPQTVVDVAALLEDSDDGHLDALTDAEAAGFDPDHDYEAEVF